MTNPTPLSQVQKGFRLPKGEWFNDIINRVNGIVAGTLNGTWTGTFNGILGGTTPAAATVTDFAQNGTMSRTSETVAAAGSTIADATLIGGTKSVVLITTTTSAEGVRLPAPVAGKRLELFAPTGLNVNVYPTTGGTIGAAATNAAVVLTANKGQIFQGESATAWRLMV